MYSTLLDLGFVKLHSYGLMIAIGFLLCLYGIQHDAKKIGLKPEAINDMAIKVLILGVIGTRVLHIIMFPQYYSWTDPIGWINLTRGGLVFQGAIPPVLVYLIWTFKKRGLNFNTMLDIATPYVPLAHGFGRIGCFLNGCCFGKPADDLPWAMQFPKGSPPYHLHATLPEFDSASRMWSYPVHPTQLYAAIGLFLLFALLWLLRKHWNPFTGFLLPTYVVLYGVLRFIMEMYRGDGNPTQFAYGLLTDQQLFAVLMGLVGVAWFVILQQRARRGDPETPTKA